MDSNKSWDNIYRFNTFKGNDGGLVIRHGQYGNYINGKSGRKESAGLRVINPNNTFFNNYAKNLEGGDKNMKAPITIMSGLEGSAINEYYPADNAIVAYNIVVNSVESAIKVGVGNKSKGKGLLAPKIVLLVGNTILNILLKNSKSIVIEDTKSSFIFSDNLYSNGMTSVKGFNKGKEKELMLKEGFYSTKHKVDESVIKAINQRLEIHNIKLSQKEIMNLISLKLDIKKLLA